jgi:carbonic anhydrase/acetyltransferase-like protein (isoleucine patch superfamily)
MLITLPPHRPQVHPEAFVAPSADLIGNVIIEAEASVWFRAVLRAETEPVALGARSNLQDGCCVHTDPGWPVLVGRGVTIGHGVILHGCRIDDGALVGMGAIVLNGAQIGAEALVGSGTLVPEGRTVPPRSLYLGVPGRVVRQLTDEDLERLREAAAHYVELTRVYRAVLNRAE